MLIIFGGTKDSRMIIDNLSDEFDLLVSVATEQGATLIKTKSKNKLLIKVGKKNTIELKEMIKKNKGSVIVDATHPYATEISLNLMNIADELKCLYFRYERPKLEKDFELSFDTYEEIVKYLNKKSGNVLITSGSNNLHQFLNLDDFKRLVVRVIPTSKVIKKCEEIGLGMDQIIAVLGPHSKEFNEIIIKEKNIKYLVTKESGKIGGADNKLEAASKMGIEIISLKLPKLKYKNKYTDILDLKTEIQNKLNN